MSKVDHKLKTIEEVVAAHYSGLSEKLREAADAVLANPVDVATRTLRAVSSSTGVAPATLSRLARALGFDSYEEMRELTRGAVERQLDGMGERVQRLRTDGNNQGPIFDRQAEACISNIAQMRELNPNDRIDAAVEMLLSARNVVLFGAFGASGSVEYLAYLTSYFSSNWMLAGRRGESVGAALAGIQPDDVVFVVTKAPYAKRAVLAVEIAREAGAQTIVITDDYACPALMHATVGFIVPSESPQFFSSYAATMVLIEAIVASLVARSGDDALERIRSVEAHNRRFGEFWSR